MVAIKSNAGFDRQGANRTGGWVGSGKLVMGRRDHGSDWALVEVRPIREPGKGYWLLARRSVAKPEELAYYVCTALRTKLVRVAGTRWVIEECFQEAKGQVGRTNTRCAGGTAGTGTSRWQCWPTPTWRWYGTRHRCRASGRKGGCLSLDERLIPLTVPEVRRLLYRLIWRHHPTDESVLRWSRWRRRHQATAQRCHYRRRLKLLTTFLQL